MLTKFSIGGIAFETPVVLAPMAGYTDLAFRLMVHELHGLGLACTEMLSPRSFLVGKARKVAQLIATSPQDNPLSWQIYGHEPEFMADGARWLSDRGAKLIDINMGCPQRKIARRGAGAGLLKTPAEAVALAEKVAGAVKIPVTAKIRLVPAETGVSTFEFARNLQAVGIAAITVHARTCSQMFTGHADWTTIQTVVEAVEGIPVVGNGDIASPDDAVRMVKETGCAAVMLGRATIRNPWLIRDCAAALGTMPAPPPPSREERVSFMLRHLDRMADQYGDTPAALLFRKWIPPYARSLRTPRPLMVEILKLGKLDEVRDAVNRL